MEKNNEIHIHDIEKLVSIIDSFYETEHFSDGWAICTFPNKPNMERIRYLLETMLMDDINILSLSDIYDLKNIFAENMVVHLRQKLAIEECFEDNFEFKIFIQKVFNKYNSLGEHLKKLELLSDIQQKLKNTLTNKEFDIQKFREIIGNKYKIIMFLWNKTSPLVVLDSNRWQAFCVDILNNTILHECWNSFEKWYSLGDSKILIFDKKVKFDFDTLKEEISVFDIKNNNLSTWDFLHYLKAKYNIKTDVSTFASSKEFKEYLEYEVSIISKNDLNINLLLWSMNRIGFVKTKKKIFIINNIWNIIDAWMFDDYESPKKGEGLYKDKKALHILVSDWSTKKVLVTNGDEFDMFDVN